MSEIVVVGLGPGDAGLLTREVGRWLESGRPVWLRTRIHPTVEQLPRSDGWGDFDALYERATDFDSLYDQIVAALLDAAEATEGPIIYAVPGHPTIGESTVRRLRDAAPGRGVEVRVVPGVSFLDVAAPLIGCDLLGDSVQIVDGLELAAVLDREPFSGGLLPISPLRPALVGQVYNAATASAVKLALGRLYPDEHPLVVMRALGVTGAQHSETVPLHRLDHEDVGAVDHLTTVFLPPLKPEEATRTAQGLQAIMARLRSPEGCPWDREQSHQSIRSNFLEETYEALDALDSGDMRAFCEELGDVLLQIYFQAQMAEEAGEFVLEDVFEAISAKLVRRHPHVFGDQRVEDSGEVLRNWDQIKAEERKARGETGGEKVKSALDGIPRSLPGLARAALMQERVDRLAPAELRRRPADFAAALGRAFATRESGREGASGQGVLREQLSALLFALVGLARSMEIDLDDVLGATLVEFGERFRALEARLRAEGRDWASLSEAEATTLWGMPATGSQ
jgi:tetrapyrrole methylase family protein/MazG family protein